MGIDIVMRWRFQTLAAALCLLSGAWPLPARAQPPAAPPPIPVPAVHERNVRWQTLPPAIRIVYIGPDQRRWYIANDGSTPVTLSDAKTEIEQQWHAPAPVLRGSRPALFEKSGRAWFISADGRTLLAYDGATWIEHATHAPDSPRGFIGDAPDRSRAPSVPFNADLHGTLLFPEWNGISTFDGTNWSYQPMPQKLTTPGIARCMLMVESDEKAAVVFREGAREAWHFHDRQWTPLPIPDAIKDPINSIALGLDGTLLVETRAGGIYAMSLASGQAAPAASVDKTFEKYLNKIDSPDAAVAQTSMDGMVSLGPPAIPLVEKILENVVDPDAEMRLREVLRRLKEQKSPTVRPKFMVGDTDVGPLMPEVFNPAPGILAVAAQNLPPTFAPNRSGTFFLHADGTRQFIPYKFTLNIRYTGGGPLFSDGGKILWLPFADLTRVDLSVDPPAVERSAQLFSTVIQAVAGDGTAYLAAFPDPNAGSDSTGIAPASLTPLVAYRRTAPEDRPILRAGSLPTLGNSAALDSNGMLWAALETGGISRFDGTAWTTLFAGTKPRTQFFAGKNGDVLAYQEKTFSLGNGIDSVSGDNLDQLIQQNAPRFAAAFHTPFDPNLFAKAGPNVSNFPPRHSSGQPDEDSWSIATDNSSRIWLTVNRTLRVLEQGEWTDAHWPSDNTAPGPSLVLPIGDGSAMYVCAKQVQTSTRSGVTESQAYLATFKDGQVAFTALPAHSQAPSAPRFFVDGDQALWIIRAPAPPAGQPPHVEVERLNTSGLLDNFTLQSQPLLLDHSDIVWLAPVSGRTDLWKSGKVIASVNVPGAANGAKIFSDKAGSVWYWTPLGLHHLTSTRPDTGDYKVGDPAFVADAQGNIIFRNINGDAGVSPRGFLYINTITPAGLYTQISKSQINTLQLPP